MAITETNQFLHTLDRLQGELALEAGSSCSSAHENIFVSVVAGLFEDNPSRHLVTLGWGVPPRSAVQDLPCAVLSEDSSQVVSAHRTDGLGQFQVDLEPGRYTLHFVTEVRSPVDIEALLQLGDEAALEFLQDCLADEQTLADLRRQIQTCLEERQRQTDRLARLIAELLTAYREHGPEATRAAVAKVPWTETPTSVPTLVFSMSTRSAPPTKEPGPRSVTPPGLPAIEVVSDEVRIRQFAREVPFGVVRVLAKGKSTGLLLGTCLVAMPEYRTAAGEAFCSADIGVAEVLGSESDPLGVDYYVVAAAPTTFAWFPVDEVEELGGRPDVTGNAELKRKVSRLIDELKR